MTARLERFIAVTGQSINRTLDRLLPPASTPPRPLHEAMRHGVLVGGKRLRPCLTKLVYRAAGGRGHAARPAACAIELVHAFSLIHDDLPCLDDDAVRRGQPTVHARYGEAIAVLAGDALLALAFEQVGRQEPRAVQPEILRLLAGATGSRGMIGGQALEEVIAAAPGPLGAAALREVHRLKTGRLFQAAAGMGALVAGEPEGSVRAYQRYGGALGLAFQIADDLLDQDEPDALSYPQNLGVEEAERALHATGATARRAARTTTAATGPRELMLDLVDYVVARGLGHAVRRASSGGARPLPPAAG